MYLSSGTLVWVGPVQALIMLPYLCGFKCASVLLGLEDPFFEVLHIPFYKLAKESRFLYF